MGSENKVNEYIDNLYLYETDENCVRIVTKKINPPSAMGLVGIVPLFPDGAEEINKLTYLTKILPETKRTENAIISEIPEGYETIDKLLKAGYKFSGKEIIRIIKSVSETISDLYSFARLEDEEGFGYINKKNVLYSIEEKDVLLACYNYRVINYKDKGKLVIDDGIYLDKYADVQSMHKLFEEMYKSSDGYNRACTRLNTSFRKKNFPTVYAIVVYIGNTHRLVNLVMLLSVLALVFVGLNIWHSIDYNNAQNTVKKINQAIEEHSPDIDVYIYDAIAARKSFERMIKSPLPYDRKHYGTAYKDLLQLEQSLYVYSGNSDKIDEIRNRVINSKRSDNSLKTDIRFIHSKAYLNRALYLRDLIYSESFENEDGRENLLYELNEEVKMAVEELLSLHEGNYSNPDIYFYLRRAYRILWEVSEDSRNETRFLRDEINSIDMGLERFPENTTLMIDKTLLLCEKWSAGVEIDKSKYNIETYEKNIKELKRVIDRDLYNFLSTYSMGADENSWNMFSVFYNQFNEYFDEAYLPSLKLR